MYLTLLLFLRFLEKFSTILMTSRNSAVYRYYRISVTVCYRRVFSDVAHPYMHVAATVVLQ